MPYWTTPTLVKDHLLHVFTGALHFEDEEVKLVGTTPTALQHRRLSAGSEVVKWNIGKIPIEDTVTMTGTTPESLTYGNIVKGSVFVALHPILTTTYVEEKDYIVDYLKGTIQRTSTSTIISATTVYVWYLYSTLLILTTDYTIDYETGELTRVAGWGIPDGATVLIDYDVEMSTIADALIDAAIVEAEDKILLHLSASYTIASGDQGLKTGSMELAISIITQALAIYALQFPSLTDSDQRAEEFRQLSLRFENQAWRTLAPFLDPTARVGPVRKANA